MKLHTIVLGLVAFNCFQFLSADCLSGNLQKFSNVTLVKSADYDGDSFRVDLGDRQVTIRLYFVDCPETSVSGPTRLRTQTRYFALPSVRQTVLYGRDAAVFTKRQLARPFTIYTSFADALGRSSGGRFYAFVETAAGEDLAHLLVAAGYARAYGKNRTSPDGRPSEQVEAELCDLESAAMLKRKGIWASSDADKLVEMRALERRQEAELRRIKESVNIPFEPVNINTASSLELETLKGIGPVTAQHIIDGRPYANIDDLLEINGVSPDKFESWRSYLTIKND